MNVLLAWELGANLGHLGRQLPVALALRERGHTPFFAVADTVVAAKLLAPHGLPFVQVPIAADRPRLRRPPASYDELLLGAGFHDSSALSGRVQAWRHLFDLLQPDVMLADHAPAALLAARLGGVARVAFGSGFEIPPAHSPHPCFRHGENIDPHRLQQAERRVLDVINGVCRTYRGELLAAVHELFAGAAAALVTLPELDHYGARKEAHYLGPIYALLGGLQVEWPAGEGGRVLAYLRPSVPGFAALVRELGKRRAPSVLLIPDAPREWIVEHSTEHLAIYSEAVDLRPLLDRCDAGISYGGNGTLNQFLLAGIPQLVMPGNVEQYLGAQRLQQAGAGLTMGQGRDEHAVARALADVLGKSGYATASQALANRHAGVTPGRAVEIVVSLLTFAYEAR